MIKFRLGVFSQSQDMSGNFPKRYYMSGSKGYNRMIRETLRPGKKKVSIQEDNSEV